MNQWIAPDGFAVVLPQHEEPEHHAAAEDDEGGEREAERLDGRVLGLDPTPRAGLQHAQHDQTEPER